VSRGGFARSCPLLLWLLLLNLPPSCPLQREHAQFSRACELLRCLAGMGAMTGMGMGGMSGGMSGLGMGGEEAMLFLLLLAMPMSQLAG
jgi:hypothetical protein